jgi:hypothetical protein
MSKTSSADLTGFRETPPVSLAAWGAATYLHAPGQYPWDDWERMELAAGLATGLAALGRSLMREADQHGWCGRLRRECGWNDDGRSLLGRLLAQPQRTAARLQWLYATDGLRFDPWEHREYYEDSPCWKRLRTRWDREQATEVRP